MKETLDFLYSLTSPFFLHAVASLSVLRFVAAAFQEMDDFVVVLSRYRMSLGDSQG